MSDEVRIYIFVAVLLLSLWFFIMWNVAKRFSEIAEMKGHNGDSYFWYIFLLGLIGMLMVVALPDNNYSRNAAQAPNPQKSSSVETNSRESVQNPAASNNAVPAETKVQNSIKTTIISNEQNAPVSAIIKDKEKVCPKCGMVQKGNRTVCWSCGQHFDN